MLDACKKIRYPGKHDKQLGADDYASMLAALEPESLPKHANAHDFAAAVLKLFALVGGEANAVAVNAVAGILVPLFCMHASSMPPQEASASSQALKDVYDGDLEQKRLIQRLYATVPLVMKLYNNERFWQNYAAIQYEDVGGHGLRDAQWFFRWVCHSAIVGWVSMPLTAAGSVALFTLMFTKLLAVAAAPVLGAAVLAVVAVVSLAAVIVAHALRCFQRQRLLRDVDSDAPLASLTSREFLLTSAPDLTPQAIEETYRGNKSIQDALICAERYKQLPTKLNYALGSLLPMTVKEKQAGSEEQSCTGF